MRNGDALRPARAPGDGGWRPLRRSDVRRRRPDVAAADVSIIGMTSRKTTPYNVTAMAVDNSTTSALVFVVTNTLFESSTLYKFSLEPNALTGIHPMTTSGISYMMIQGICVDGPSRELWLVTQQSFSMSLTSINTFGIASVVPKVIDGSRSTIVT